jgi:hypothetical protein
MEEGPLMARLELLKLSWKSGTNSYRRLHLSAVKQTAPAGLIVNDEVPLLRLAVAFAGHQARINNQAMASVHSRDRCVWSVLTTFAIPDRA